MIFGEGFTFLNFKPPEEPSRPKFSFPPNLMAAKDIRSGQPLTSVVNIVPFDEKRANLIFYWFIFCCSYSEYDFIVCKKSFSKPIQNLITFEGHFLRRCNMTL